MKGYKTIVFNIVALLGSLGVMFGIDLPQDQLDEFATGIVSVIGIGNLILRTITDSPVFKK